MCNKCGWSESYQEVLGLSNPLISFADKHRHELELLADDILEMGHLTKEQRERIDEIKFSIEEREDEHGDVRIKP